MPDRHVASDISIRVEQCIDSDEWVWSLVDSNGGVICDGYSVTEADARRAAKARRVDEISWRNEE
jgi:hypothetical protein